MEILRKSLADLNGKRPTRICFSQEVSFVINWLSEDKMPRAKKDKANAQSSNNQSYKSSVAWINIALTDDDADTISGVSYDPDNVASQLLGLCLDGYAIGVKPTANADGWMAYITGSASDNPDIVVGLAGYSDSSIDAVISLLYKFHDKLDGVLNSPEGNKPRKFR